MTIEAKYVYARGGKGRGELTGGTRRCTLEGCGGIRYCVRWTGKPYGHSHTWPCGKGMYIRKDGQWQIR